jgi:hypothetical protein
MEKKKGMRPPTVPPTYTPFDRRKSDEVNLADLPRPGTASEKSKSSSISRHCLSNFSNLSYQTPDVDAAAATNANAILQRVLNSDSLLRILDESNAFKSNEVIMMSEVGDLAGLISMIQNGVSLLSCRGLSGYTPLHHCRQ